MSLNNNSEKEHFSSSASAELSAPNSTHGVLDHDNKQKDADDQDEFEAKLAQLPAVYRAEILKQYEIPDTKVTIFSIYAYSTWVETLLMIVGTVCSVGSGTKAPHKHVMKVYINMCRWIGAAMPLMTVIFGNLTNAIGGFTSPGSLTLGSLPSGSGLTSQVSHLALEFVYLGIGVLAASFLGTFSWTLSGERISRRIRGLYLQSVLRQNVAFFDRLGAGEVTNRVSNDAELVREGISDKVLSPFYPAPFYISETDLCERSLLCNLPSAHSSPRSSSHLSRIGNSHSSYHAFYPPFSSSSG